MNKDNAEGTSQCHVQVDRRGYYQETAQPGNKGYYEKSQDAGCLLQPRLYLSVLLRVRMAVSTRCAYAGLRLAPYTVRLDAPQRRQMILTCAVPRAGQRPSEIRVLVQDSHASPALRLRPGHHTLEPTAVFRAYSPDSLPENACELRKHMHEYT